MGKYVLYLTPRMVKQNSKDKIIESARLLFMKQGMEGVRMQMVADNAGVNKGLLHYYYKSKGKLFTAVFNKVVSELLVNIKSVFENPDANLTTKINKAVDAYFDFLSKNPRLPVFFIFEINRDAELLRRIGFTDKIKSLLESASSALPGERDPNFVFQFIITLISLSIFPFMIKPIFKEVLGSEKKSDQFLYDRKEVVKEILNNMTRI
jgi:AcrR family transcriptional regulator